MPVRFFLANAFATHPHGGNQAAVVLLPPGDERAKDDTFCRTLGQDFDMPMTAIVTPKEEGVYAMRWWTGSGKESMLCGHATLATSFILFNRVDTSAKELYFDTVAGRLTATCVSRGQGGEVSISLPLGGPSAPSSRSDEFGALFASASAIDPSDIEQVATYMDEKSCIVRLKPSVPLADLKVNTRALYPTIGHYCIATQVKDGRINSRVFVEGMGIPEDPVTGSAHAALAEYYLLGHGSGMFGPDAKSVVLDAHQVSRRGGAMRVSLDNGRVKVVGKTWIWGRGRWLRWSNSRSYPDETAEVLRQRGWVLAEGWGVKTPIGPVLRCAASVTATSISWAINNTSFSCDAWNALGTLKLARVSRRGSPEHLLDAAMGRHSSSQA